MAALAGELREAQAARQASDRAAADAVAEVAAAGAARLGEVAQEAEAQKKAVRRSLVAQQEQAAELRQRLDEAKEARSTACMHCTVLPAPCTCIRMPVGPCHAVLWG